MIKYKVLAQNVIGNKLYYLLAYIVYMGGDLLIWLKQLSSTGDNSIYDVNIFEDNTSTISGYFSNTTSFSGSNISSTGGTDVIVSKLDSSGTVDWTKNFGGTSNDVSYGSTILDNMDFKVKNNIISKGNLLKEEFNKLKNEFKFIESVTGTGLLLAIHLDEKYPVSEVELILRQNGLNVIHGGKNAIRFTPWFLINDDEINLIITILKNTFSKF